ncbi:MAG: hypothetical protein K9N46_09810 [Candidatus Marinimicrobia bacterium]|nr:hypothetical protein [Candidatus Neomarinimicrobiota bacterium]MCF7828388.1 hypothetical protein [Candidatus Neomarinimicrobiota bacterium]MCF7881018.1 hypothetical protein [Candidatus Neomarinimicrobiota bacterium]
MTNLSIQSCRNVLNNSESTHNEIIEALNCLEVNDAPEVLDAIIAFLKKSLRKDPESTITKLAISSLRFNCVPIENLDSRKKDILKSYCQSTAGGFRHWVLELLEDSWDKSDLPLLESIEFPLNPIAQELHLKALSKLESTKAREFIQRYRFI